MPNDCMPNDCMPIYWTTQDTRVENYLNVMQNLPIFSQMLVLMWEASQWVLVPKFSVVLELQAFKFKSTKKDSFSKEKRKLKLC